MVTITKEKGSGFPVEFVEQRSEKKRQEIGAFFSGDYLETMLCPQALYVGLGKEKLNVLKLKEITACAVRTLKEKKVEEISLHIEDIRTEYGAESCLALAEGAVLGSYEPVFYGERKRLNMQINMWGVKEAELALAKERVQEGNVLGEAVLWARDLVNTPGNLLRPLDFAAVLTEKLVGAGVACETMDFEQIQKLGMGGITAVGGSSNHPPCMLIMRYGGNPDSKERTGLIGKGVTLDTGGYCLKSPSSMGGIKGDMAGGAAVAGSILALAQGKKKVNVTGIIPMCENRISPESMVPGDVITAYGGKTIEILNTDAEGRLILADAAAYGTEQEMLTKVVDIATLTGAIVNMLGFTTAGTLSNDDGFYQSFEDAAQRSGERYLRLPVWEEQEKMLKSKIANLKNMGENHCGTIAAGIFIRSFVKELPWIHLDIAGTASVGSPMFAFQAEGATGAGLTTLYQLLAEGN